MHDSVHSVRYSIVCKYCVYGELCSSLLIESTDSMINHRVHAHSTLHSLILLNSEAKIFNTYSIHLFF